MIYMDHDHIKLHRYNNDVNDDNDDNDDNDNP